MVCMGCGSSVGGRADYWHMCKSCASTEIDPEELEFISSDFPQTPPLDWQADFDSLVPVKGPRRFSNIRYGRRTDFQGPSRFDLKPSTPLVKKGKYVKNMWRSSSKKLSDIMKRGTPKQKALAAVILRKRKQGVK